MPSFFCSFRRLLFALLLSSGLSAQAQVSKLSLNTGIGLIALRGTSVKETEVGGFYTIGSSKDRILEAKKFNTPLLLLSGNLCWDQPVYAFSDEQALGLSLNAGLHLAVGPDEAEDYSGLLIDFPEYVTWRYGAKATKHSDKQLGVGVGLGYRWSRHIATIPLPFRAPNAMLEGVFSAPRRDYYLRVSIDMLPSRYYKNYSSEGLVEVLRMREMLVVIGSSF